MVAEPQRLADHPRFGKQSANTAAAADSGASPQSASTAAPSSNMRFTPHGTVDTGSTLSVGPGDKPKATVEQLYPEPNEPLLGLVIRSKIGHALKRLRQARLSGDPIDADDAVSLVQSDLADMFLRDDLPDGPAAAFIALHHGLRNRRSLPLTDAQYDSLIETLGTISTRPALMFKHAVKLISGLRDAGFKCDPPEASELHDLFAQR